jgi:menaquinone-9 beta-reductase
VVIVGAGPAGSAAALRIADRRPDLAARTLVVDRRTFPRDKLCAGGLSPLSEAHLARIGAAPAVVACPVAAMEVELGSRQLFRPPVGLAFRTVRRIEFDAALVELARRRGVAVVEGERVRALEAGRTAVTVVTDRREHEALTVIGADGANSVVRREIGVGAGERGFALEVLLPGDPERDAAFSEEVATFDFAPIRAGLGGYCWIFPSRNGDSPLLNCGIAVLSPDSVRSGQQARSFLVEWLASRGLWCDPSSIRGHSGIAYDPDKRLGGRRVCLAGDAAGVDPYWGEGIPCALATGIEAADAVITAIDRGEFDLTRHHEQVRRSSIGIMMREHRARAHSWYGRDPVERYFQAVRFFGRAAVADRLEV